MAQAGRFMNPYRIPKASVQDGAGWHLGSRGPTARRQGRPPGRAWSLRKTKLSATTMTMMRTGQSSSTLLGRHLIFKFEFHLMFQYPARKWFGVTGRRVIARTGLGASIA